MSGSDCHTKKERPDSSGAQFRSGNRTRKKVRGEGASDDTGFRRSANGGQVQPNLGAEPGRNTGTQHAGEAKSPGVPPQVAWFRRRGAIFTVAAALLLVAVLWLWRQANGVGEGEYVALPGNGHVHAAAALPFPGTNKPSVWLGTHDGLYIKALGEDALKGWRKMEAPMRSTDVMALGAAAAPDSPIYAAGHNMGVQRSDDGGGTWRQIMPGVPSRDVHALAVDPQDSNRVYVWAEVVGLMSTSNGGATWEAGENTNSLKNTVHVATLAVSHSAGAGSSVLYEGTNLGLFMSTDGGLTWSPSAGPAAEQPVYSLLTVDRSGSGSRDVYAGTATSMLHSPDGGNSWEEVRGASSLGGVPGLALVSTLADKSSHLLAVNAGANLFESSDRGATWTLLP